MKAHDRELIDKLVATLERLDLNAYLEHVSNRKRMIWINLFYGMLRGLGFSVGFTVLGAALIVIIKNLIIDNIPLISGFVAEVLNAIEARM